MIDLARKARRLGREAGAYLARWRDLRALEATVSHEFERGRFAATHQVEATLIDFYRRGLRLPAPAVIQVDSLEAAARAFEPFGRLPLLASARLESLHQEQATMAAAVSDWKGRLALTWQLPRAAQEHVALALWSQTLGLTTPTAPLLVLRSRSGTGSLLEQLAGRVLEAGVWCAWLLPGEVVALRPPRAIHLDPEGRLHSRGRPAVQWADGTGLYANHGSLLPAHLQDPTKIPMSALLDAREGWRDTLIELVGYERILSELPCRLVDFDLEPSGYPRRLVEVPMEDESLLLVLVTCPSTGKTTQLRVPPDMKTCRQAVAWTFGFDNPDDYQPWRQT
ncbi:MAG: hypothetical protein KC910_05615 [Candidatus Eremiobacteraeota bacterium]|nr:hypothetical protein [Candidatus Eremiobacteraeota bacterium]